MDEEATRNVEDSQPTGAALWELLDLDSGEITAPPPELDQGSWREGDELLLQGRRLRLLRVAPPAALQGYNDPHRGRAWPVGPRQHTLLGRSGKRINHITLEDPTVSRAHATIERRGAGYHLLAEAQGSPTLVNGKPVLSCELKDGDLIRLGNSLFAFHRARPLAARSGPSLQVFSLGKFEAKFGSVHARGENWRSHLSRFVLAYLAAEWPAEVSIEKLLDTFWPEMDRERARNNLRTALTNMRSQLQVPTELGLWARTSSTIQFSGELDFWHDLTELRRLLAEAKNLAAPERISLQSQALELYRGKYLEDCYFDFAVRLRDTLEQDLLKVACELIDYHHDAGAHEMALACGQQAVQLDCCCQEAYAAMIRAVRALGRPREALKIYESCSRSLSRELDVPPSIEVEREYQMARLEL